MCRNDLKFYVKCLNVFSSSVKSISIPEKKNKKTKNKYKNKKQTNYKTLNINFESLQCILLKLCLVWFYGISTIVGYLMPNPCYTYKQFYFK